MGLFGRFRRPDEADAYGLTDVYGLQAMVALANWTARVLWAMETPNEEYQNPSLAKA